MKRTTYLFLFGGLMLMGACQSKQPKQTAPAKKSVGELFAEAYQKGDWATVVAIGDTLIGEDDKMILTIAYAEGLAAIGNPEKALGILDKKLESSPDDYYLYQTKGNVYAVMEKYDSAIISYNKVIEMKPTYARPYINEGEIYELIGDKENAIANYLAATYLFVKHKFHKEAAEYGNRVLKLDPNNAEAKELLDQIP